MIDKGNIILRRKSRLAGFTRILFGWNATDGCQQPDQQIWVWGCRCCSEWQLIYTQRICFNFNEYIFIGWVLTLKWEPSRAEPAWQLSCRIDSFSNEPFENRALNIYFHEYRCTTANTSHFIHDHFAYNRCSSGTQRLAFNNNRWFIESK